MAACDAPADTPARSGSHFQSHLSATDRADLVALYHATDGPNWTNNTNWLSEAPIGTWYGVSADPTGRVTMLRLDDNGLRGRIPPELGSLTTLERLWLSGNELRGPIPPELGQLQLLRLLLLQGNQLSGEVPGELAHLVRLRSLRLEDNQLRGAIPPELGRMGQRGRLQVLKLGGSNQLTGCIPEGLRNVEDNDLADLRLPYCGVDVSAPDTAALVALYFATDGPHWTNNTNWLSGAPLHAWQGVTTDSTGRVVELSLPENELSGEIPSELGNLTNLRRLFLSENRLRGEIPPELGRLANLEALYLDFNRITGSIPSEFGNLANLASLSLAGNQLSGSIPAGLGRLANLVQLSLWDNQLGGTIPAELGRLTSLQGLYLDGNQLRGDIPPELAHLTNLQSLYLRGSNQFTGCVPAGLRDVPDNDLAELGLPFCEAS